MRFAQLILVFLFCANSISLQAQTGHDYAANTVIFKVKSEYRALCETNSIQSSAFYTVIQNLSSSELKKIFPHHKPPRTQYTEDGLPLADLSLIYELTYSGETSINKLIYHISKLDIIEYAQHRPLPKLMYVPNDDSVSLSNQYHLGNIQAYAAWDIVKGDTNIVIGITDTGIDPDHPDLVDNIKYNYGDTIDGIDNDNDGFVDNFAGWDMADNDKDPSSIDADHHGTRVAGIAAASTDNSFQGAGIAFKCKFLPIKIQQNSTAYLTAAYEGIVYAADHGCQIINCSWGSQWPAGQWEQDIIDYATLNMNALVIASAGNKNNQIDYYPAALKYVISVGATDILDEKWITGPGLGSTYGRSLDICAPGADIYSTLAGGGFNNVLSGTSFAAPVVSGCAALIKAKFPNYSALQIGEQLKVTADVIDTMTGNLIYKEKLGSGRVNLFKAVSDSSRSSIKMINSVYSDGNDEVFRIGDTVSIIATLKNYLAPISGVFLAFSSTNSNITIVASEATIGNLNTLETASNFQPLQFRIEPTIGNNEAVELRFVYHNGIDSMYEYATIYLNPANVVNINTNNINTSLTDQARMGFEDAFPVNTRVGLGIEYKGEQMIFEMGLMVGAQIGSTTYVSDNIWDNYAPDVDFINESAAVELSSLISDFEGHCVVNDDGAGLEAMSITVDHSVYAWSNVPDHNYVMIQYRIINKGSNTLLNLFAGIASDWDILNFTQNKASSDPGIRMGYVHGTEPGSPYGGIKLLSQGPFIHYAIDIYENPPGVNIYDTNSFSTSKKYIALSTNKETGGGGTALGNDILDVVSSGPFTLAPQDTIVVSFAIMAGDNLLDLSNAAYSAQAMYDSLFTEPPDTSTSISLVSPETIIEIYPNPSLGQITLFIGNSNLGPVIFELFDLAGSKVYATTLPKGAGYSEHDISNLKAGIYQYRVHAGELDSHGKLVLVQ